jgi:UDP:flavonoid glycosyltransferase YjiC (YdhE family)
MLPRAKYNAATAAQELGALLTEAGYTTRAAEVGRQIRSENGASAAADAIEEVLRG